MKLFGQLYNGRIHSLELFASSHKQITEIPPASNQQGIEWYFAGADNGEHC
jgi:hypothetical protein